MILLDTDVVSEAMKPEPHPSVRDWLGAQAAETLFLSSVTIAELLFGIRALPRGSGSRERPPTRLIEEWRAAAAAGHRHADAAEDDDRDHADRGRCWSA